MTTDNTKPLDEAATDARWGKQALYRLTRLGKLKAYFAKGSSAVRVRSADIAELKMKGNK